MDSKLEPVLPMSGPLIAWELLVVLAYRIVYVRIAIHRVLVISIYIIPSLRTVIEDVILATSRSILPARSVTLTVLSVLAQVKHAKVV